MLDCVKIVIPGFSFVSFWDKQY